MIPLQGKMNKVESNMVKTKVCTKCGVEKPVGEFHKGKYSTDGLRCYCKKCGSDMFKKYHHSKNGLLSVILQNQRKD